MASPTWARYRRALAGEPLPAALIDLDAVDANVERLLARSRGKPIRLATKSIRCPALVRYLLEHGGGQIRGLLTYSAAETAFLAEEGFADLLLAYPTMAPRDLELLAGLGEKAAVVVDCPEHLDALEAAASRRGARIPVVIEVDLGFRPLGVKLHIGVRRSPLRSVADVVALARRAAAHAHLRFHGVMGYEAHIAGLADTSPLLTLMKRRARPRVEKTRADLVRALAEAGLPPTVVNGGGTGSLSWSSGEDALTEVAAGSGFLCSHLFDAYQGLPLEPAAFFALQVVRRPAPTLVTCHGGGFIASGAAGKDRLPRPWLPEGLRLLPFEGAGEVQTPLAVPPGVALSLGDPVFFRHAKAGELAEHFNEYLMIRGERIQSRAPTYRGLGQCFLG